jgi:hypothetical protein
MKDIPRLRADFIRHAVEKVRTLMSKGDRREIDEASDELGRYFEWVKDDFSPDVRDQLSRQILVVQHLRNGGSPRR